MQQKSKIRLQHTRVPPHKVLFTFEPDPSDGFFIHESRLPEIAEIMVREWSTREVARLVGIHQPRVVEALDGRSPKNLHRIVHYFSCGDFMPNWAMLGKKPIDEYGLQLLVEEERYWQAEL